MIRMVLTDFDDTLCLTEAAAFDLENMVAQRLGVGPMAREVHLTSWGMPIRDAVPLRFPDIAVEQFLAEMPSVHHEFIRQGKIDRVEEHNLMALRQLRERGMRVAVLTSRMHIELDHLLTPEHPLQTVLHGWYHREKTAFVKPDPRVFDVVFREYSFLPSEMVYVGDALSDAQCALQAGMHFVACMESGLRRREEFTALGVQHFAERFQDIVELVEAID